VKRSPKIQFLFWNFTFCIIIYLWVVALWVQNFVLNDTTLKIPENVVITIAVLYIFLVILVSSGVMVAVMIGNKYYSRAFSIFITIVLVSIIGAKSIYG